MTAPRFCRSWRTLREQSQQDWLLQLFHNMMRDSGLTNYIGGIEAKIEQLLLMDEEDLIDEAINAGMKKDARKTFLQVIDLIREKGSDTSLSDEFEPVEEAPPQELVDFMKMKGLEKYAHQMYNARE